MKIGGQLGTEGEPCLVQASTSPTSPRASPRRGPSQAPYRTPQPQLPSTPLSSLRPPRRDAMRLASRTLHDLGDSRSGRPVDLVVTYSKHHCRHCGRHFAIDLSDLALPKCLYTRRVQQLAVRLVSRGRPALPSRQLAPLARPPRLRPLRHHPELGRGGWEKKGGRASRPPTSTRRWLTSPATWPSTRSTTAPSASSRSWTTAGTTAWPSASWTTTRLQDDVRAFLTEFKGQLDQRGLSVRGITTDGSSLYPKVLKELWPDGAAPDLRVPRPQGDHQGDPATLAKLRKEMTAADPQATAWPAPQRAGRARPG